MVVDDHPVFRYGLASMLHQDPDFEVVGEASSGPEAVSRTEELRPDVIVMDVHMPGGGGVEATLNMQEVHPEVKVLILTVSEKDEDLFDAMEAGARGYLLKDAKFNELLNAVRVVASGEVILSPVMARRLIERSRKGGNQEGFREASNLSLREREVPQLVAQGYSNKEIGGQLYIDETTVKAHLRSIMDKLQAKNRAEAVAKAAISGLIS